MPVTTTSTPREEQRSANRLTLLAWLGVLVACIAGLDALSRLGIDSPATNSFHTWPTWFASHPGVAGVLGVMRLGALAVGGYLLAVTGLALAARMTGDARAVWLATRCTVPSLRPLLFGIASLSVLAAPAAAGAEGMRPPVPVLVRAAADGVAPPPVLRPVPTEAEPPPGGRPSQPPTTAAAPSTPAATGVTLAAGDHLWKVAESALATAWHRKPTDHEIVPYWLAVIERNRSVLVDPTNPDLVLPGQVFQLPPLPDPPPG